MIDYGGGMIFPDSYDRDQYTLAQEAAMEWAALEEEAWLDDNAWLLELPEAWSVDRHCT